jgi:hypothetical protein
VVEAQLEVLSFSVPICVIIEVCHLYTYVIILIEILFSRPMDVMIPSHYARIITVLGVFLKLFLSELFRQTLC